MESEKLEKKLGISFKNKDLLTEALTHRSYLNEYPQWHLPHNERLEYLGDAVLELIVSEALFLKFPDYPEGPLTVLRAALVNYQILARVAEEIGLDDFILMSRGERRDTGKAREVILANAIEAVIGAMYMDQGIGKVSAFVMKNVMNNLDEVMETKSYKDAKSELQELVQEKLRVTPTYRMLEEPVPRTSARSKWACISATSSWPRARGRPSRKRRSLRRRTRSRSIPSYGALFETAGAERVQILRGEDGLGISGGDRGDRGAERQRKVKYRGCGPMAFGRARREKSARRKGGGPDFRGHAEAAARRDGEREFAF